MVKKFIPTFVSMKLKQKLAIGLCAFYVFSVIGIALSMHFCGGKLASVAINAHTVACKFCKTEPIAKKDDGCCKNTKVDFKVKDSHQKVGSYQLPKLFEAKSFLTAVIALDFNRLALKIVAKLSNKAPPKPYKVAIYLFNCVFRN
jgi:hypothetical protein